MVTTMKMLAKPIGIRSQYSGICPGRYRPHQDILMPVHSLPKQDLVCGGAQDCIYLNLENAKGWVDG